MYTQITCLRRGDKNEKYILRRGVSREG
jgi:hypothetical protein